MKDSTALVVGLLVLGAGAYLLMRQPSILGADAPRDWRAIIGSLPPVPPPPPKPDVGVVQGTVTGASYGAVAGPWGAAIGAGAGAVASFFM